MTIIHSGLLCWATLYFWCHPAYCAYASLLLKGVQLNGHVSNISYPTPLVQ